MADDNLIRMTFYIDGKAKARLDKLSDETDRPVAAMIRRAIEAYLDAEESALRKRK